MKQEIDIYTQLNDIVNAMKEAINIVSISAAVDGVQTIVVDTIVIFDNLSRVIKLTNGMIVTINSITYPVSNIIDIPAIKSFDIEATDLTIENETTYNIAANFQTGTLKEINEILNSEAGNEDRFPLIWLLPTADLDTNQIVLDFTASVTLVYAHKTDNSNRTTKSITNNFIPVLQPLRTLFEAWMQSSDFNYMLEFNGFGKPINGKESDIHFFGNDDKSKSIIDTVSTDAKRIVYELNFKKQFGVIEPIIPPEFTVSYRNAVVSDAAIGLVATLDFEAKINTDTDVKFTVNWGANIGTTIINTTLVNDVWKSLQTKIFIPEGVDLNQIISITDNFGGALNVSYTISIPIFQCDVAGVAYADQTDAYGLVFDGIVNKKLDASNTLVVFINQNNLPANSSIGYALQIRASESIRFLRITGTGNSTLFETIASYTIINTDYRYLVFRNETLNQFVTGAIGTFVVYIQGKTKPITTTKYLVPNLAEMELVAVTGGSGTNPITDNTYTISNYFVIDFDEGDQTRGININGDGISPADFTVDTGVYSIIIP